MMVSGHDISNPRVPQRPTSGRTLRSHQALFKRSRALTDSEYRSRHFGPPLLSERLIAEAP